MKNVIALSSIVLVCLLFLFDFYCNLPHPSVTTYTRSLVSSDNTRKVITSIDQQTDNEWLSILKTGNIVSIRPIREEVRGLAEKWLVVFESGHEAMVKPVERWSIVEKHWPIYNQSDINARKEGWRIKKTDRKMQGYNEIAAYYLDRVLGLYRKPPIVGRFISSKLLYEPGLNMNGIIHSYFEQAIPVSVHGWMEGLRRKYPSETIQAFLTLKPGQGGLAGWEKRFAGDVSDTLIFDFLIDDHDRELEHNWMTDQNQNLLLWDSGLAFSHGPNGKRSCLNLLCGPEKWIENFEENGDSYCSKICRFRRTTIEILQEFDSSENETLGMKLKHAMESDILNPIMQYNLFYLYGRHPKIRFQTDDFYDGLDFKVSRFLEHVNSCISNHGEDRVLVEF